MRVVTSNGTVLKATIGTDSAPPRPLTDDEAKALADRKNKEAEKLGIETRYEAVA